MELNDLNPEILTPGRPLLVAPPRYSDIFQDVKDFMIAAGQKMNQTPGFCNNPELRNNLIYEEWTEIQDKGLFPNVDPVTHEKALDGPEQNLVEIVDGCIDLIYVAVGLLVDCGVPFEPFWKIVHEANMKKFDGPISPEGKQLKPEGWQPPDILGKLKELGYEC